MLINLSVISFYLNLVYLVLHLDIKLKMNRLSNLPYFKYRLSYPNYSLFQQVLTHFNYLSRMLRNKHVRF